MAGAQSRLRQLLFAFAAAQQNITPGLWQVFIITFENIAFCLVTQMYGCKYTVGLRLIPQLETRATYLLVALQADLLSNHLVLWVTEMGLLPSCPWRLKVENHQSVAVCSGSETSFSWKPSHGYNISQQLDAASHPATADWNTATVWVPSAGAFLYDLIVFLSVGLQLQSQRFFHMWCMTVWCK